MNILDYLLARFRTGRNLKKMRERYAEKIEEEMNGENRPQVLYHLKLAYFVEPQTIMSMQ